MSITYEEISGKYGELLKEIFSSDVQKGFISIGGTVMPKRFAELAEEILNMEVRDDDTWVCTFPKSGTTWTQEMVWLISKDLDYEGAKEGIDDRFPFLELTAFFDYRDNEDFKEPLFLDSMSVVKNLKSPRFIKTHLPWQLLPLQIQNKIKRPKIFYTFRNPKDACTSYFHHGKLFDGYIGNFQQLCELFLADRLSNTPYWSHLFGYWNRRNEPNIIFLKYEDMKADISSAIRKVSQFVGKQLDDQQVETLAKHLSFESMKKNESVNRENVRDILKHITEEGSFLRKGVVGSHKEEMTPEMVKRFDDWIKENTEGTEIIFHE